MTDGPRTGRPRLRPPSGERERKRQPPSDREKFLGDRERQRRALAMWARKVSYAEIARQMGCSGWAAWHLVRRGLESLDVPGALERRAQENEALDEIERITWGIVARPGYRVAASGRVVFEPGVRDAEDRPVPMVEQQNRLAAVGMLLRIQERRARLNGLDAPAKLDVQVSLEAAMAAVELLEQEADRREAEVKHRAVRPAVVELPPGNLA